MCLQSSFTRSIQGQQSLPAPQGWTPSCFCTAVVGKPSGALTDRDLLSDFCCLYYFPGLSTVVMKALWECSSGLLSLVTPDTVSPPGDSCASALQMQE